MRQLALHILLVASLCACGTDGTSAVTPPPSAPTISLQSPSPQWVGTKTITDAGKTVATYSLSVDFSANRVVDASCAKVGTITATTSTELTITYPDCGTETLSYSFSSSLLTGTGITVAVSDGRKFQTGWRLTR